MKALLIIALAFLCQSIAFAETTDNGGTATIMLRSCDSPYLGNFETCVTSGKTCPPGYVARNANFCAHSNDMETLWHRCGTTCESIYGGGRGGH